MDLFSNFLENDSVVTEIGVLEGCASSRGYFHWISYNNDFDKEHIPLGLVRPTLRRPNGEDPPSILPIFAVIEPFFEILENKSIATYR